MKKWMKGLLLIVVIFAAAALGYYAGYQTASCSKQKTPSENYALQMETFYATIKEIQDGSFLLEGLSVNDINYRGLFYCPMKEDTVFLWRGLALEFSDFEQGDRIAVTFGGEVRESYPGILVDVLKIQLLEEEE